MSETLPDPATLAALHKAEDLASGHAMEMGEALARRGRVAEAVLGMAEAGAHPDEVIAGLIMAGLVRKVPIPLIRLPGRNRRPRFELVDAEEGEQRSG